MRYFWLVEGQDHNDIWHKISGIREQSRRIGLADLKDIENVEDGVLKNWKPKLKKAVVININYLSDGKK